MGIETILQEKAQEFAESIIDLIRGSALTELFGETVSVSARRTNNAATNGATVAAESPRTEPAGRLKRRSETEIAASAAKVAALLQKKGDMRSEQIRAELDLLPKEMPRIMKTGIESKLFRVVSGEKRSTTYGVGKKAAKSKK